MDVVCPHCRARYLNISSQYEGRTVRCKKCNNAFVLRSTIKDSSPALKQENMPSNESEGATVQQILASESVSRKSSGTGESTATGVLRRVDAESRTEWAEGDLVMDLYEVKKLLGEGAMGKVFRVRHREWGIDIAVKTPKAVVLAKDRGVENFEREAETWVNLGLHPHIVSCYYVRRIGGIPRVFAEYIEGGSLADWIAERKLYGGGPEQSLERMLNVAIQFAWGLHYAHEQGLIHQDVKPGNLMMTPEGTVKITDFGLARAGAMSETDSTGTPDATMVVQGVGLTPAYASPEQLERRTLTRRSDLWSWGLSVFEMFAGRRTWPVGSVASGALDSYLDSGSMDPEIPAMPGGLAELLRRCFRENPDERPHDLDEVADALREIYGKAAGRTFPRLKPKAGRGTADSLHNRAVSLLDLGRVKDAGRLWDEAVRIEPHHPEATYGRGLHLWRSGRMSDLDVVRQMEGVINTHPDRWIAPYLLAQVHLERGAHRAAQKSLASATRTGGDPEAIRPAMERAKQVELECVLPDDHMSSASARFSPDGRFLLTAGRDGMIRLRDAASWRCVQTFTGHTYEVLSAFLTPDNRFLVSSSQDRTLKVWDAETGRCIRTFRGYSGGLSLSGDGRLMLAGVTEKEKSELRLWEIHSGRCVRQFGPFESELRGTSLSEDGRRALSFGWNRTAYLRLWDTESGECIEERSADGIRIGLLSRDGRHVLRYDDRGLAWWKVGAEQPLRVFEGYSDPHICAFLSADNRLALSENGDRMVKLWEVESGRCLRSWEHGVTRAMSLSLHPDGRLAASTDHAGWFMLWDVSTGHCLRKINWRPIESGEVILSRDGSRALSFRDASFELWDTKSGSLVRSSGLGFNIKAATSDEDGRLAVAADSKSTFFVQDIDAGERVGGFSGNGGAILCLSIVRKARYLMAAQSGKDSGAPDAIELWDLKSARPVRSFEGHVKPVRSLFLSASIRLALSGGEDCTVRLWDVASARCLRTFEGHADLVHFVCLSEDGRTVLSASRDGTLRVWEAATGRCLRIIETGKGDGSRRSALSPDGKSVLSASSRWIQLLEVATGRCRRSFEGHRDSITSIFLTQDGRKLLSGSRDQTMRLWSTAFTFAPYEAPLMLTRVNTGEEALSIQSRYEAHIDSARAAIDRGEADEAARLLRLGRSLPGYGRAVDAMVLWQDLYLRLPIGGFRGTWEVLSFQGHEQKVTSISLTPDGRYALTGSEDMTMKLWETATGKCLRQFDGYGSQVESVALSEDGSLAIVGAKHDENGAGAGLWETATGRCVCTFQCSGVTSVRFIPGEHRALLASPTPGLSLCDTQTGRTLHVVPGVSAILALLTPDGTCAIGFGRTDRTINLWQILDGSSIRSFQGHHEWVNSASMDALGRFLLSRGGDQTLKLWEIATGVCLQTMEGTSVPTGPAACSLSMSGKYAFTGELDGSVQVWDTFSGRCLHTVQAHSSPVTAMALSRDNRFLLSAAMDGELKLLTLDWELEDRPSVDWDEEAQPHLDLFLKRHPFTSAIPEQPAWQPWSDEDLRRLLHTLGCTGHGYIRAEGVRDRLEAVSRPKSERLAVAREALDRGDFIKAAAEIRQARSLPGFELDPEAFDLHSRLYEHFPRKSLRNVVRGPFFPEKHEGWVRSLCFSPDGWYAMSGSRPFAEPVERVKVWDLRTGRRLRTFEGCSIPCGTGLLSEGGSRAALYCGEFGIFDTQSGQLLHNISGARGSSADGSLPPLSREDRLRFFIDVAGDRLLRLPVSYPDEVECSCLGRDGRYALTGGHDKMARYWDLESGRCVGVHGGHQSTVMSVCMSTDGRLAVTGDGGDYSLQLWDLKTGNRLQVFRGHQDIPYSVCLSEDGRYVLSGSNDKTVKLWETEGGRCIWTSNPMKKGISAVALSPNGRHILAADADGEIALWLVDWEIEEREPSDWDPGAAPFLDAFLNRLSPEVLYKMAAEAGHDVDKALSRWAEDHLPSILRTLGCAGFGFLRREGVLRALSQALSERKETSRSVLDARLVYEQNLEAANAAFERGDMPEAARQVQICRSQTGFADERAPELWRRLCLHLPLKGLKGRGQVVLRLTGLSDRVKAVAFTPDGHKIVSIGRSDQPSIGIWDVRSGHLIRQIDTSEMGAIITLSLNLDGTLLFSNHPRGGLCLWDPESGQLISRAQVLSFSSDPACLFPEGGIVASPHQNLIFLYDLKRNVDMEPIDTQINHVADPMVRLAVSRDGRLLLSGQKKGTIILWDAESRRRLRAYMGHTDAVSALAFTPGGNRIVSASADGSLRLWDLKTGNCLHEMSGGAGAMTSLSLTADGKFCVTGDIGNMVKLWNLDTGQWLHTFSSEHTLPVLAVCISPDNRHLLSGSSDKTVCLWEIDWELDV